MRPCSSFTTRSSLHPREVRDQVRNLTRMQRLRTCAAWRPDTVGYRDPVVATKLSLKYPARRVLDLNDEIAELDRFIGLLVEELAPNRLELEGVGIENAGELIDVRAFLFGPESPPPCAGAQAAAQVASRPCG